jgi:hypothetical protein
MGIIGSNGIVQALKVLNGQVYCDDLKYGNKEKIFNDSIEKSINHRGGNLNLVIPFGDIGNCCFVNLKRSKDKDQRELLVDIDYLKEQYFEALSRIE